jgi:hypothetical protein
MGLGRATKELLWRLNQECCCMLQVIYMIAHSKNKSSLIGGFSNPELLGYVSGDRAAPGLQPGMLQKL